jgi:hypothetical protein
VLAAIELDDSSHDSRTRALSHRRKEKATADAGILLIRWNVESLPDSAAIRAAFDVPQPGRGNPKASPDAPPSPATLQG